MAIIITNISKDLRPSGRHKYRVAINNEPIVEFLHNREDGLEECLIKAGRAVGKKTTDDILDYLSSINAH